MKEEIDFVLRDVIFGLSFFGFAAVVAILDCLLSGVIHS
jgi:hypothetical protein